MADDIVSELRQTARACNHGWPNGAPDFFPDPTDCARCLRLTDAADEIERLEFERDEHRDAARDYKAEIERLRGDLGTMTTAALLLAKTVDSLGGTTDTVWEAAKHGR